jgi:hypothetical protein
MMPTTKEMIMENQPAAQAPSTVPSETPVIPTTWPGAFGVFKHSKQVVQVNLWAILGLNLITLVLGGFNKKDAHAHASGTMSVLSLVGVLISFWLTVALVMLYLAGIRGEKLSFVAAFKRSLPFYLKTVGATILSALLLVLSLLALVVPFFFVLPRLVLINYFIVDRNAGPIEAIKLSWNGTKGHSLKVWGIIAAMILFAILCFVLVGIYLLFFYQAALAVLYTFITQSHQVNADNPAVATEPVPAAAPENEAVPTDEAPTSPSA